VVLFAGWRWHLSRCVDVGCVCNAPILGSVANKLYRNIISHDLGGRARLTNYISNPDRMALYGTRKKNECGGVQTRHQRRIDKLALSQMGHSTGHVQVHQFASRQQALKLSLMYELSLPVSFLVFRHHVFVLDRMKYGRRCVCFYSRIVQELLSVLSTPCSTASLRMTWRCTFSRHFSFVL